jgi:hypothetical protein
MPFQHKLACPHAGQWHLLFFRKKVNKKLSTAPFAMEGSSFTLCIFVANAKVEKEVNFSL